jgi:hypothetical protein
VNAARPGERRTGAPIGSDDLAFSVVGDRLAVRADARTLLDISIDELRRIQFDIERGRPATLVIVPERPSNEPQIVAVRPEQFQAVGDVLAYVGQRLDATPGPDAED